MTNLVPVAALGELCGALLTTSPTLTLDSPSDGAVASVEFFVGPRLVGLIIKAYEEHAASGGRPEGNGDGKSAKD